MATPDTAPPEELGDLDDHHVPAHLLELHEVLEYMHAVDVDEAREPDA